MANLLLIETSGKTCSVALTKDFGIEWYEETTDGPHHASILGTYVEKAMNFARKNAMIPDAIAVSCGPGSYTGLRIGISEAKGLCFGLQKPLIAINTLQTMCCHVMFHILEMKEEALLCPMIDARRMEVYTVLYDQSLNEIKPISAEIIDAQFLKNELDNHEIFFFGDGADKCQHIIQHPNAHFIQGVKPLAKDMLAPAVKAYNDSKFEDVAYFVPLYLKDFVATKAKNILQTL